MGFRRARKSRRRRRSPTSSAARVRRPRRPAPPSAVAVARLRAIAGRSLRRVRKHRKLLTALGICALLLITVFQFQVDSRFASELFPVATRAYSKPIRLKAGVDVARLGLVEHLLRLGYRPVEAEPVEPGEFVRRPREIVIVRRPFPFVPSLEDGGKLIVALGPEGRVVDLRDAKGSVRKAFVEPELIGSFYGTNWVDRHRLPVEAYPQHLIDALITVEDRRFFEHGGIDLRRIAGAAFVNMRAGRIVQGASTLTQQLVKNLYLSSDRSLLRKLQEAPMALYVEWRHDKQDILEAYLNEIYLGQRGPVAIHGMGAAAHHYFGKDASELTLGESAFLVGLIRGPGLYSPQRNLEAARGRRDVVLRVMLETGRISEAEHAEAVAEKLVAREAGSYANAAPYFLSSLRQSLADDYAAHELETEGYVVLTTLDPSLQRRAQTAIDETLATLERQYPELDRPDSPLQAALVAIHPATGDLLALVGGRDYARSQFNRAEQARRQPGSAFKPVAAVAALTPRDTRRPPYTLASVLSDTPVEVETPEGMWSPTNYDGQFAGPLSLREALERSRNVPFVRLGLAIGLDRVAATARRMGIASPLEEVPSLVLGASEVSPLELTSAYAVLAAEGMRHSPRSIRSLYDDSGNRREAPQPINGAVLSRAESYLITSALRGAIDRGTGIGLRRAGYRGPVAGKTGTTNDERDAWFVGYTPELAIGVWVGFDDNASLGLTGGQAALPIFERVLTGTLGPDGGHPFRKPRGLESAYIDTETGTRASVDCQRAGVKEIFLAGTAPTKSCVPEEYVASEEPDPQPAVGRNASTSSLQ